MNHSGSIQIQNIRKTYDKGKVIALDQISFDVKEGEIFGLIGPDGAGKTSLFRILTTLLLADSGSATVDGFDVVNDYQQIRKLIGYMPGKFSLYQDLTVEENLEFFATLFNTSIQENYELIRDIYVQIEPFKKRMAGKLSGGMKQKLALSCALIHRPKVLFLDEPTTGVDPVSRKEFWEMLKRLQAENITILVSTPYMDEANLCDRIAFIQSGKIMQVDTPEHVISSYQRSLFAVRSENMFALLKELRTFEMVSSCYGFGDYLHVAGSADQLNERSIEKFLEGKNYTGLEIKKIQPEIEDCFMGLMESGGSDGKVSVIGGVRYKHKFQNN